MKNKYMYQSTTPKTDWINTKTGSADREVAYMNLCRELEQENGELKRQIAVLDHYIPKSISICSLMEKLELENANLKEQVVLHEKITEERVKQFKELEKTCEKWKRMAEDMKSQEDIADE